MSKTVLVEKPTTKIRAKDIATAKVQGKTIKVAAEGDPNQLGDVFFFSIRANWEWHAEELRRLSDKHGLNSRWLPRELSDTSAFKRATEILKLERTDMDDDPGAEVVVRNSIFVRDAPRHHRLRHIVKEVRKGRESPKYIQLGTMEHDSKKGVVYELDSNITNPQLRREFEDMQVRVAEVMQHALTYYTDRDLRNLIGRAVEDLNCISVRSGGAVFFSPIQYRGTLANLEKFLSEVGVEIWILPVSETNITPEKIGQKLVDTVNDQCDKLLRQVVEYAKSSRGLSPGRYDSLMKEYESCTKLLAKYESLLDLDIQAADIKLQATNLRMQEMRRLVKGGN